MEDSLQSIAISRCINGSILVINDESIDIADYVVKSTSDGMVELTVVIKGRADVFDFSVALTK